jgi:hypothetical protein
MVTNLTAEARAKWAEATATKDPVKKLRLLQEFYSIMPHHKGTEKLEVMVKRQMAALREEIKETKIRKKGATRLDLWSVRKGEFPQIALLSDLNMAFKAFEYLTGLKPELYQLYKGPIVGPFKEGDVILEVFLTPYSPSMLGKSLQEKIMRIIRQVDLLLIIAKSDVIEDFNRYAENFNLEIVEERSKISVKATESGGIRIIGSSEFLDNSLIVRMLQNFRIFNAIVEVGKNATLDDLEAVIFGRTFKNAIIIDPSDRAPSSKNWRKELMNILLRKMGLIKVYTKSPGGDVGKRPLLVKHGYTTIEIARLIHKDLAKFFKYAKIYRNNKVIKVGKEFELKDGDVVEIYT